MADKVMISTQEKYECKKMKDNVVDLAVTNKNERKRNNV